MKTWLIHHIKRVSLRYGFYPHLLKLKRFLERGEGRLRRKPQDESPYKLSGQHTLCGDLTLTEQPVWLDLHVKEGTRVILKAGVEYLLEESEKRKSILLLKCFDKAGNELGVRLGHLSYSPHFKAYFKYLSPTGGKKQVVHELKVPSAVCTIKIGLARFNSTQDEEIKIAGVETLIKVGDSSIKFTPPSPEAAAISILGWPEYSDNGKPYAIGVMDEFTTGCFEDELNLIQPRPDNWYALAEKYSPTVFFIESAWKGNNGSWQYRVGEYNNKPGHEVAYMTEYGREKGIPSVFWNKEDPVHHQKFMGTARLVDHIFTTDANMCDSYRKHTGNDNVHALPFAAQPAIHKPAALDGRLKRSCFAGSWYGNRHAERGKAMKWLIEAAHRHGLDIYDRNYGTGIFSFPERYQADIKGSLPYKELCEEYRHYRVFLNVNSVTDSPTMFSRRVFELMACGTPVVSTYARGIEELFESDAVWMVSCEAEAEEAIQTLLNDDVEWRRRSLAGIREVFSRHTYAHRLNEVFEKIGLEQRIPIDPDLLLLGSVNNEVELKGLHYFAQNQHYREFNLIIECPKHLLPMTAPARVSHLEKGSLGTNLLKDKIEEVAGVGWLSTRRHYGPDYLRDLVNAMSYQIDALGWSKAIDQDAFEFGKLAVLSGSIWQPETFMHRWLNADPEQSVQHENLFIIDSSEFSAQVEYQMVEA